VQHPDGAGRLSHVAITVSICFFPVGLLSCWPVAADYPGSLRVHLERLINLQDRLSSFVLKICRCSTET
jgi:hypothetical protein